MHSDSNCDLEKFSLWVAIVIVTLAIVGGVGYYVLSDATLGRNPAEAAAPAAPSSPRLGDTAILDGRGYKEVRVYTNEGAIEEAAKAQAARDQIGFDQLVSAHQLFEVPHGTRVLVIDLGGWCTDHFKVRLLSGEHTGRAVWVTVEDFKKQ